MNEKRSPAGSDAIETDASAELGLRNPVRDKKKLGDEQYNVTPPRDEIQPPSVSAGHERCGACSAELDPQNALRSDAKEYAYYFCGVECQDHWQRTRDAEVAAGTRREHT